MTSLIHRGLRSLSRLPTRLSTHLNPSTMFARREPEGDEIYLAAAADMGDLERRIRQLERGNVQHASTQLSMMSWRH
jgi:hypothetical protein